MRDQPVRFEPEIEPTIGGEYYWLAAELPRPELTQSAARVGLSAVIEESDGTKSYWALAHGSDKPDFHDPDCFVARLP